MDYKELIEIFIRCIVAVVVLFILVKIMGKKQIAQLNLFDYIIGISIGSVAADISIDIKKPLIDGLFSMTIYALLASFISFITIHSIYLRRFFTGVPTLVMENGKIIESGLRKVKFDINDFLEQARSSGYYNLNDIDYAIMETSGNISFLPKKENMPVTLKDMKLKGSSSFTANIIIDGNIMKNNLKSIGKDEKWLLHELKIRGYSNYQDILLLLLDKDGNIYIYEKNVLSNNSTLLE